MADSELGPRNSELPSPPIEPMPAKLTPEIPAGPGWLYEPKWDGFRCIVYSDGANDTYLQSRFLRGESRN